MRNTATWIAWAIFMQNLTRRAKHERLKLPCGYRPALSLKQIQCRYESAFRAVNPILAEILPGQYELIRLWIYTAINCYSRSSACTISFGHFWNLRYLPERLKLMFRHYAFYRTVHNINKVLHLQTCAIFPRPLQLKEVVCTVRVLVQHLPIV